MKYFYIIIVFLFVAAGSTLCFAYTDEDCIRCHATPGTAKTLINFTGFKTSVHFGNDVGCQDCHAMITDPSHETRTDKTKRSTGCTECHDQENRHGIGSKNSPMCYDCHTRHRILPASDSQSSTHSDNLLTSCGKCHSYQAGNTGMLSFLPSIKVSTHEKQNFSELYRSRNCIGCHQGMAVHGTDETVNDHNCRTCHFSPDGTPALWGIMHPDTNKHPKAMVAAVIQLLFLFGAIGFGIYLKTGNFSGTRK